MAVKTLIMGLSGTGKSTSLRNINPDICAVVNPVGKPLPFKDGNKFTTLNGETNSEKICRWMNDQAVLGKKIIVVDDFQYLLSIPYMKRIHENGWDKWNDFGSNYFDVIEVAAKLPDDVRIYYLSHCETLEDGTTTIKLIGRLLREKISIEGLFTIALKTAVIDGKYYFLTQNSGKDTVKSPMGMFPDYAVENDLSYIDDKVCNYYEIGAYKSDEEMAKADEAAGDESIEKPTGGRRARASESRPRRSREEVQAENNEKMGEYMNNQVEAAKEAAGDPDAEEVPFEDIPQIDSPELEKLPRSTRKKDEGEESQFTDLNPPKKKPRGRKAREIEAQGNPEEVVPTENEATEDKPARRRRAR